MFGPNGNPTANNLFEIVAFLQHAKGVCFEVQIHARNFTQHAALIIARNKTLGFYRFATLIASLLQPLHARPA
jgi:hypothetical protein